MTQEYSQSGQHSNFSQMARRGPSRPMEPPVLFQYPNTPVYDLATLVQLIKLRPQTLWAWEQQLGISAGEQGRDPNGHKRRYSERDLVALLWIRERVVAGETPREAAARLLAAQRGRSGPGTSGALNSGSLNSGALVGPQSPTLDPSQGGAGGESWAGQANTGLSASYAGMTSNASSSGIHTTPLVLSGATQWNEDLWNTGVRNAAREARPGGYADPLRASAPGAAPQMGGPSGRLGAIYSAAMEPSSVSMRGPSMTQPPSVLRELRSSIPQLLDSFARFDTARASAVMMEALHQHGVESVCIGLVQPAVARISDLWSKSELTNPEERFALNYLRGFMYSVFQSTQEPLGAPFAVVGCAPNETSDFGALLLAVLWRRAGMRVAYLGIGVEGDQLIQQKWPIIPAIIALTATSSQRIRALARIGKKLSELPAPQPIFAYSGAIFARSPELKRKLPGVYLGDDAGTATYTARQLLNMDAFE